MKLIEVIIEFRLVEFALIGLSIIACSIAIQGLLQMFGVSPKFSDKEQMERAITRMRRPIRLLESISSLAPYMGIFGTVLGILISLSNGSAANQARLAALTTTAGGMLIGIVCVALAALLNERVISIELNFKGLKNEK